MLGKRVLHCQRNRYSSYEINHYVEIDYVKKVTGKKMKQKSIKTENNAHDQKGNLKKLGTIDLPTCRLCTDVVQVDLPGV